MERVSQIFPHASSPGVSAFRKAADNRERALLSDARSEIIRLSAENVRIRAEREAFDAGRPLHGNSLAVEKAWRQVLAAADENGPVLISGEPGVGKRRAAYAVIELNRLNSNTAIAFDCTLPGTARELESLLAAPDRFAAELSSEGIDTVFLDGADALDPALMGTVWPILQPRGRTFRAIATCRDDYAEWLAGAASDPATVSRVYLPPLRMRRSDIVPLTEKLIDRFNAQLGRNVRRISTPAMELLMAYTWPGNVGELAACLRRGVDHCRDAVLQGHHLPMTLRNGQSLPADHPETLQEALDRLEYEMIVEALQATAGNGRQAAELLGLTERKLGLRLRKYGLESRQFRY